ncbi:AraC family transcriptional regulator [Granulicella rosea]|uniref:AraC family transcriptional regulator n=1 Tax=Granulicella rosea TaxID=474952 RepID=A0A239M2T4_9BACT|nr:AraC family transcriptional regulator [Granulicella rosea]SNT36900.1 AraC family transcriptional regulator [Granulicella rosea]
MSETRIILVGADDPLPSDHFWHEGEGFAIYTADQPRSTWREHTHEHVQVTIGLEPAHMHAEWRSGGKVAARRELSGNSVTIIPAGEPHRTLWQRRATLIHVYLDMELLAATARSVLHLDTFALRPTYLVRDPFVEELGRALYRECRTGALSDAFAKALLTVLATHLLRTYSAQPGDRGSFQGGLAPARERRVREYVETHLDQELSLEVLAKTVDLSPSHFATLFRQSTGFTAHQYVCHRRVKHAQNLLIETAQPLVEIAAACGFTSQSQFTTLFRRFTGLPPGKFRQDQASARPAPPE